MYMLVVVAYTLMILLRNYNNRTSYIFWDNWSIEVVSESYRVRYMDVFIIYYNFMWYIYIKHLSLTIIMEPSYFCILIINFSLILVYWVHIKLYEEILATHRFMEKLVYIYLLFRCSLMVCGVRFWKWTQLE